MKTVAVIKSASGEHELKEVDLAPGSTTADVLIGLGLPQHSYLLSHDGHAQPFADDEELYDQVRDGAKLRCVPKMTVGLPILPFLGRVLP